ncbi:MAG TPA: cation transporter [Actinomycetota bacterium]|nr:cation transporter [Actinomycetota bacterium]
MRRLQLVTSSTLTPRASAERFGLLGRALRLEYMSVAYNALEAVVAIVFGMAAGSLALIGFGLDSVVEASSASVLVWRLRTERTGSRTAEDVEKRAVRLVAVAFFVLATYILAKSGYDLVTRSRPEESIPGIVIAVVSILVMPLLAWRKRVAARALDSRALQADSSQTTLCTYLSVVLLAGLGANALWGWWWADPVSALLIGALAVREGRELWRTEDFCCV